MFAKTDRRTLKINIIHLPFFLAGHKNAIQPFSRYKSMGAFCCHDNQPKRQTIINLAILNCPYPSNMYQIRVILLQWFQSCHLKKSFFKIECSHGNQTKWPPLIKHMNWADNHQMIITAKFGSHHFNGYGEKAI